MQHASLPPCVHRKVKKCSPTQSRHPCCFLGTPTGCPSCCSGAPLWGDGNGGKGFFFSFLALVSYVGLLFTLCTYFIHINHSSHSHDGEKQLCFLSSSPVLLSTLSSRATAEKKKFKQGKHKHLCIHAPAANHKFPSQVAGMNQYWDKKKVIKKLLASRNRKGCMCVCGGGHGSVEASLIIQLQGYYQRDHLEEILQGLIALKLS